MSKYPGSLHNHTDYSNETLRDCINKVGSLIDTAIELGHECVAITDHETISSYVKAEKYYKKVKEKHPEFKLIRGNEIYLTRNDLNASNYNKERDRYFHFILLCCNLKGYRQICELSTRAWKRSYITQKLRRRPTYYKDLKEIVRPDQGNLIASSACLGSQLDKFLLRYMDTDDPQYFETALDWCRYIEDIFGKGNFYLEMQPSKNKEQVFVNKNLLKISELLDIPYIITTDSHYLRPEDAFIHESFLNAQDGEREVRSFYETTYMMTDEEIRSFFPYLTDEQIEKAYDSIREIYERCEDFSILKPLEIPSLPWRTFNQYSRAEQKEYAKLMPELDKFIDSEYLADRQLVLAVIDGIKAHKDLQNEMSYVALNDCLEMTWISSEINKARWSAYYLNLQKIVDECWNAGTIVMAARGSGGGFLLLYALDIIQINCLREHTKMYPWRFLNPARVSVLDIDIDISGIRREQVLNHLRKFYGENRVSNVATFKVEKSKSAILTACRGLGIDVDEAQYLSSLITVERGQAYTLKQMYYGDEAEGIKPSQVFIDEVNKHENLWEVASKIEGLICGYGIHAGGVVFTDKDFTESSALMRAPDGTIITQLELHDLEDVSMIKMDLLSVESEDKIHICLDMLIKDGYIKEYPTLRETYDHVLNVYDIDRDNEEMWQMVNDHRIIGLFQMEQASGIRGISLTHPKTVDDLATLNSVIRLMPSEKGAESPLDKYSRLRVHPEIWEREMIAAGLTERERQILHNELDITNGLCINQEQFMKLVQLPECGGWDLQFADRLRKSIAKKNPKEYEQISKEFFEKVEEENLSRNFCNYVWNVQIALSRGYGFNASHTFAYSIIALQEMNLAYKYPIVYWNTANLIVDSGGVQTEDSDDEDEDEVEAILTENSIEYEDSEEEEEWEEANPDTVKDAADKKKKKVKVVDYGRVASIIGKMGNYGIKVSPPDINKSSFTFTPDAKDNLILYGLRGITRVSVDKIKEIIENRPYSSMQDFLERIKVNKLQMINLIKSGAFDSIENKPREQVMNDYLDSITDKKQRLTLQNMQMLIDKDLIPEDMIFYKKLFSFNKFLKKGKNGIYYNLNDAAIGFLDRYFDLDFTVDGDKILQRVWDNTYKKAMEPMRQYLKEHKDEMLAKLNQALFDEVAEKYAEGNVSKWEMDSISFYAREHELAKAAHHYDDFFKLPEEPIVDYMFTTNKGQEIRIYQLSQIIGTVIDKDKVRNTVTLLTPTGVVNVKVYKNQYAGYDKQISQIGDDGKKHVMETSWFKKGTLLMVQGIRRGNDFIPKKYKSSMLPIISKIISVGENGELTFQYNRVEVEDE